ncbi:TetR/AcrR family transcriptional regulator [Spirillospora sp. NPDC048911]|uniref:TetR/AcrR family transcriptional regulator n=1 Tax=Spirillospora sp. NPDC048911 TaxID=3364527 RepID=UPI003719FF09
MTEPDSRKRTAETKRRRTRAALLIAARALFSERGWHGTKLEEVARLAGVSPATAYNHFKNKQTLLGHVYAPLIRRRSAAVTSDVNRGEDPILAIHRHFYELADLARRRRTLTESLVIATQEHDRRVADAPPPGPEHGASGEDIQGLVPLSGLLTTLIEYGQRHKLFLADLSAADSAAYYTNALLTRSLSFPNESAHETALTMLRQLMDTSAARADGAREAERIPGAHGLPPVDDLSRVLSRLMGQDPDPDRHLLANSRLTREYLRIGLEIAASEFSEVTTAADGGRALEPVLDDHGELLSRRTIEEGRDRGLPQANQLTFSARWPDKTDFLVDLLAYSLWVRFWQPQSRRSAAALVSNTKDPVDVARELSRHELNNSLANPARSTYLLAMACAPRFPELEKARENIFQSVRAEWIPIYDEILSINDLELRPGVDVEELVEIFSMMAESAALRIHSGSRDYEHQHNLLHKGALAVLLTFIDPGDQLSVEELARQFIQTPGDGAQ